MKSIALIERALAGNAVEEKRIEQEVVAHGQLGIDGIEVAPILSVEIGRRSHAGEQHGHVALGEASHDLFEGVARGLGIDAAQHVIGAEFEYVSVRPLRHRSVERCPAPLYSRTDHTYSSCTRCVP